MQKRRAGAGVEHGLAHGGRRGVREHERVSERGRKVDGDRGRRALAAGDQRVPSSATSRWSSSGERCEAVCAAATRRPTACAIAPMSGRAATSSRPSASSRSRRSALDDAGWAVSVEQRLDGPARHPAASVGAVGAELLDRLGARAHAESVTANRARAGSLRSSPGEAGALHAVRVERRRAGCPCASSGAVRREDEVAEAPRDELAALPRERLEHVRVRAEDERRAGRERGRRELPLAGVRLRSSSMPQWNQTTTRSARARAARTSAAIVDGSAGAVPAQSGPASKPGGRTSE